MNTACKLSRPFPDSTRSFAAARRTDRMLKLLCAAAFATCSLAAQAGYITSAPAGFTFTPGPPSSGGDWAGPTANNPNKITGTSGYGGINASASFGSLHFTPNPVPLSNAETEYDFEWTIYNPFAPIAALTFSFQNSGLLTFDGGLTGSPLNSMPTSSLPGTLVSWTPTQIDFVFSGGGLGTGQSATFHLPLDVLSPVANNVYSASQTVVAAPTAVPEPGTAVMFGASLLALSVLRRRRGATKVPM